MRRSPTSAGAVRTRACARPSMPPPRGWRGGAEMGLQLSRRGALAALGGAGLALGLGADGALAAAREAVTLSDWVRIAPDGGVTLYTSVQEMGQGAWCVH